VLPLESRVIVEDPSWVVVKDWPSGGRVMQELPSFVVVACPEPVTRIMIGGTGLVSFSEAKSVLDRAIATTIGTGSFKVAKNVTADSADANRIQRSL
jgi:hypothetical protein